MRLRIAIPLILFSGLLSAQNGQQPNLEPGWPCTGKPRVVDPAYVRTSEATGGQVFLFDRSEVRGFALLANGNARHSATVARASGTVSNYVDLQVPVDPSIESLFVSVSLQCKQRVIVYDPKSQDFRPDPNTGSDDVFLAGRIVTIPHPEPGVWTVRLLGTGTYFAVVQAKTSLNVGRAEFQNGQVSIYSMPGSTFRLVAADGQPIQDLALTPSPDAPGQYSGSLTPPGKGFRVEAHATDAQGYLVQRLDGRLYEAKP